MGKYLSGREVQRKTGFTSSYLCKLKKELEAEGLLIKAASGRVLGYRPAVIDYLKNRMEKKRKRTKIRVKVELIEKHVNALIDMLDELDPKNELAIDHIVDDYVESTCSGWMRR